MQSKKVSFTRSIISPVAALLVVAPHTMATIAYVTLVIIIARIVPLGIAPLGS